MHGAVAGSHAGQYVGFIKCHKKKLSKLPKPFNQPLITCITRHTYSGR